MGRVCYERTNGSIITQDSSNNGPCGPDPADGAASCCHSGHYCLNNGFCVAFDAGVGGKHQVSGYYLGGCTDPTVSKHGCRTDCDKWGYHDAIWDYADNNIWTCCGTINGTPSCFPPQGPSFSGPDSPNPLLLEPYALIVRLANNEVTAIPWGISATATAATATASGATATSTIEASVPVASETTARQRLSGGSIAAIIVGVLLGLGLLVTSVVCVNLSRRQKLQWLQLPTRRSRKSDVSELPFGMATEMAASQSLPHQSHQLEAGERAELPSSPR